MVFADLLMNGPLKLELQTNLRGLFYGEILDATRYRCKNLSKYQAVKSGCLKDNNKYACEFKLQVVNLYLIGEKV